MAKMVERVCKCGVKFQARSSDVKRGWARSCSKSCAAKGRDNSAYMKWRHCQREYGGVPNFDRNSDYIGFQCTGFSNEE